MKERSSGILLHISSLPGQYGIGDFGNEAYRFVDFLSASNTTYWQILPLGITSFGDSPYQSFSAFAGNPYFIDLEELINENYLSKHDVNGTDFGTDEESVDYEKLYFNKYKLLKTAFNNAYPSIKTKLNQFKMSSDEMLHEFSLFMAIKSHLNHVSWLEWPQNYKKREPNTIQQFIASHQEEIDFWVFTQYYFFKQWDKLKAYANQKGVKIVGDIPIYVAMDSADVWANPTEYQLDKNFNPKVLAGVPPDSMSDTGQLWGNPIYNWSVMKENNYRWWINRVKESFKLYDVVRIDHFRGFESYWEVPFGDETALNGRWVRGPGIDLFDAIKRAIGEKDIIAEDLGFLTEAVNKLIEDTRFPGMNVLVFGVGKGDEDYLPHN